MTIQIRSSEWDGKFLIADNRPLLIRLLANNKKHEDLHTRKLISKLFHILIDSCHVLEHDSVIQGVL